MNLKMDLPDLNNESHIPLYIQLADLLMKVIEKNNLKENDSIPSENELLKRYQISRSTIRQSFSHLEKLGRVQKIRGKGTFVKNPKHRQFVRGFQDIEAGIKSTGSVPTNKLIEVRKILSSDHWVRRFNLKDDQEMTLLRRIKLSNQKPIAIEERVLSEKIHNILLQEDLSNNPIFNAIEDHSDTKIQRVTYIISSTRLSESEAFELDVDIANPVFRRIGTYFDQNDDQIMFSRLTFLADSVELSLEFHREDDNWGLIKII